ncbi:MAG: DUF1285 domain-containing protein [Deltaproteobacteria bacterium]|nr:DUF1285 domain-containing protein [Deltaproteobacteria bacterium]
MPGAGFYAIHTSKISFRSDGRWYADDDPILHERLARLFSRYLRRKSDDKWEIWIDERYHADVEVEDTPYVITGVDVDSPGHITIHLNDGTAELLDPSGLRVGANEVLYCRVKQGNERARFLRPAYYHLVPYLEEPMPGQYELHCGGQVYSITQA